MTNSSSIELLCLTEWRERQIKTCHKNVQKNYTGERWMGYQKSSLQFSLQTHPFIFHFFYWDHLSHGLLYLKLLERIIFWPRGNVEAVSAQRDWVKKLWGQGARLAQEARHLLTYPGHHAFSSPSLWA